MLCSLSFAGRRLSAALPLLGLLPSSLPISASSRFAHTRTATRPLPAAGTYDSRRARRAAEFGPPTGLSAKERQRQQAKESRQRSAFDQPGTPSFEQPRRQRQSTAEQSTHRAPPRTSGTYSRERGASERQSSPNGRGGYSRERADERHSAPRERGGGYSRGRAGGERQSSSRGRDGGFSRGRSDGERQSADRGQSSEYSRGRSGGERRSAPRGRGGGFSDRRSSSAAERRSSTPVRGRGHRRGLNVDSAGGNRAAYVEERMEADEDYDVREDVDDESEADESTERPNGFQQRRRSTASDDDKPRVRQLPRSNSAERPTRTADRNGESRTKLARGGQRNEDSSQPPPRHRFTRSDSPLPARSASSSPQAASAPDGATEASLRFDGQTYAMAVAEQLSGAMAQSYSRLSAETGIPIVPPPLQSTVVLEVSPMGRLYMRWGGRGGRKSTHAVQAAFMLRSERKKYQRGEATKELPLVRALATAMPQSTAADAQAEAADSPRSPRTATQHYLDGLVVLDATPGLCRDAAVPLFAGAEVYAVERNPAIYALLRYDIDRRLAEPAPSANRERLLERLHVVLGDSLVVMRALAGGEVAGGVPVPDVVMIDVWTDDSAHVEEFKTRQIARMLRHLDAPASLPAAQHVRSKRSGKSAEADEEDEEAEDVPTVARREQLQQRESALLAEARRAAKRCVVLKRPKSTASKSELLAAEGAKGAVAVYRSGVFEFVVYSARNERWEADGKVAEPAAGLAEEGKIDAIVDESLDVAMAVAEERRDL